MPTMRIFENKIINCKIAAAWGDPPTDPHLLIWPCC